MASELILRIHVCSRFNQQQLTAGRFGHVGKCFVRSWWRRKKHAAAVSCYGVNLLLTYVLNVNLLVVCLLLLVAVVMLDAPHIFHACTNPFLLWIDAYFLRLLFCRPAPMHAAGACSQHFLYCILVFINNMIFTNVRTWLGLSHWLPTVALSLVAKQAHTAVEAARPLLTQGPRCWQAQRTRWPSSIHSLEPRKSLPERWVFLDAGL